MRSSAGGSRIINNVQIILHHNKTSDSTTYTRSYSTSSSG